jgi:hypothetical protein
MREASRQIKYSASRRQYDRLSWISGNRPPRAGTGNPDKPGA